MDAEKTFNNVKWQFMGEICEEFAFEDKFLNVMQKKIYPEQNAKIHMNNELMETFEVQKGTKQGCPLSPLLFIMVLEILLINIQREDNIKGIKIKNYHFKYRVFADDVVHC